MSESAFASASASQQQPAAFASAFAAAAMRRAASMASADPALAAHLASKASDPSAVNDWMKVWKYSETGWCDLTGQMQVVRR